MDNEIKRVGDYLSDLQSRITSSLQDIDGQANFLTDEWQRDEGGGGRSMVLQNGAKPFEVPERNGNLQNDYMK